MFTKIYRWLTNRCQLCGIKVKQRNDDIWSTVSKYYCRNCNKTKAHARIYGGKI